MNRVSITEGPALKTAYGLDLSERFATVVRVRKRRGSWRAETILSVQDPSPTSLLKAASDVTAEASLGRAALCAAMPAQESTIRRLTAPLPSLSKARKVWPSLLDIQLPFPLETCAYGFLDERKTADGATTLAVLARKEDLSARVATCASFKMDPHVLDHEGLALWSQSQREAPINNGQRLVIYLGMDRSVWVIGDSTGWQGGHASKRGRHALNEASAVTDWRDRTLRLVRAHRSEDSTPLDLYWCGPGAEDSVLCAQLESALSSLGPIRAQTHSDPDPFLARAVAVRALLPDPCPWNYRDHYEPHPLMLQWRDKGRRALAYTALSAGLVLCLLNTGFQHWAEARDLNQRAAISALAREVSGLPHVERGQEELLVQRALEEQAEGLAPFLAAFRPSLTEELVALLRATKQSGLTIDSLSMRPDQIILQGAADDWDRSELLATRLRERDWRVTLDRQDAIADELVRFRLTAGGPS